MGKELKSKEELKQVYEDLFKDFSEGDRFLKEHKEYFSKLEFAKEYAEMVDVLNGKKEWDLEKLNRTFEKYNEEFYKFATSPMKDKIEDIREEIDKYLDQEVKDNMKERLYSTIIEVAPNELNYCTCIYTTFTNDKDRDKAIKELANIINHLYHLGKIWKGFLIKAFLQPSKCTSSIVSYPLLKGNEKQMKAFRNCFDFATDTDD